MIHTMSIFASLLSHLFGFVFYVECHSRIKQRLPHTIAFIECEMSETRSCLLYYECVGLVVRETNSWNHNKDMSEITMLQIQVNNEDAENEKEFEKVYDA